MSPSAPPSSAIGTRYQVLEQLGRGGMAVVYRVLDTGRNEEVALKQLQAGSDVDKQRKLNALFEREFYVLAQLEHPSVVQVYDFGHDPAGAYYTMELLDGGDLEHRAPLPARSCCDLMLQVCSALSLLHSRGFIHRDVGPRNVRCTRDGRAKLIDFGAMVPMGPTRQVVGTPAFTAPEAIHGLSLDARTDLFSVGATLYFALTGRAPFAVRVFNDLAEAWRVPPPAPSELVPDVPPELDALVLSLLRVDPAHRPRSSAEIMQRLATIADRSVVEAAEMAQAYLQTPTLVGREDELRKFRAALGDVKRGAGSSLWLEAPSGGGRSRLLDAWVLEAKLQGVAVVRAGGQAADAVFASIYDLCEQVLEVLPERSASCARDVGVFERLFEPSGRPRLLPLPKLLEHRDKLPQALSCMLERICREHALCIVLDDAERADEPSLSVLAALAHAAPKLHVLLALGVTVPLASDASAALALLAKSSQCLPLPSLTREQMEMLFASVFGNVPNVALVSERIHTISVGNPRVAMSVAEHIVEGGLIRYVEGSWLLPAELTLDELPADGEQLLRTRIANLSPLARRLAELQALAMAGQFTRADYAELAGRDSAAHVDRALDALVRLGLVSTDGVSYTLAHRGDRVLLLSALTPERCGEHHLTLAGHFAGRAALGIAEVHHLLSAGARDRALDRLELVLREVAARGDAVASAGGISIYAVAATLERAFECSEQAGRPAREQQAIVRSLVTLSVATDNKLYWRYAGHWFARLERDSGLADYRALDPSLPAPDRLKRALEAAVARYQATPEAERVYRVDEAIRYLARHVTISIAIGARARSGPLLHSLASKLEPFAALSPLLYALWQNSIAAYEMNFRATIERARERALHVYEKLGECQGAEVPYAELVRKAVAAALANIETGLGLPSAAHWLEMIEHDSLQSVNANYLRRLACIVEGDRERAEHYRTRAEVLALQSSVRQMFMPPLRHELVVQIRASDLAGVKQCVDQMERLAQHEPGWNALLHMASGYYEHLRGDLDAAQVEFERSLALCGTDFDAPESDPATRVAAAAGYVGVLTARGRCDDARAFGRSELARCEPNGMQAATWDLVRALALAEAKLGEHESAARRIDALIELRAGVLPAHRFIDYETRVRVAIEAKDQATIQRYMSLLAERSGDQSRIVLPRQLQLSDEARRAGVELALPETHFQTIVLAPRSLLGGQALVTRVVSSLATVTDRSSRAQRALELLCEAASEVLGGVLYLANDTGLSLAAERGGQSDADLTQYACSYWLQIGSLDDVTGVLTQAPDADGPLVDGWQRADGRRYRPIVLRANTSRGSQRVGLAVLVSRGSDPLASGVWEVASALGTRLLELGDATAVSLD